VRGDAATQAVDPRVKPAVPADWDTEYEDAIISVKLVDDETAAIAHIETHGSHHTDSIITADAAAAERFRCAVHHIMCDGRQKPLCHAEPLPIHITDSMVEDRTP